MSRSTYFRAFTCALAGLPCAMSVAAASFTHYADLPFNGGPGSYAETALLEGKDGSFYGTGLIGFGTIYRLDPSGVTTLIHQFSSDGEDGADPHASVVRGPQDSLWGTTEFGGPISAGSIWKVDRDGNYETVYQFLENDSEPMAPLFLARDGNFYGTTEFGGTGGAGSIFRISPEGNFQTLYSFVVDGVNAANPRAGLVQTPDGNLWGTLYDSGPVSYLCQQGCGGVFRMSPDASVTIFMPFIGTNGINPDQALTLGKDGLLYGVTSECAAGVSCLGIVFSLDLQGNASILHSFGFNDPAGGFPSGPLLEGKDGFFYGETQASRSTGPNGKFGTVFRLSRKGKIKVLHDFALDKGTDLANWPIGGLIEDKRAGQLYGVAHGGPGNTGAAFTLSR